jgi:hypothetical protein
MQNRFSNSIMLNRVVKLPQFSQITRTDRHNPSRGQTSSQQDNRLSSSGHFSRQIAQEDEAAQHSSEEFTVSEKHSPTPGFSLASIRILPDSGQLSGHAKPGWMPSDRLPNIWPVQAKLTINQPGDKYEEEADRVAEQVMRMPEPGSSIILRWHNLRSCDDPARSARRKRASG